LKISEFKTPNTFVIIGALLFLTASLTWIIPAGEFDRTEKNGRKVVVNNSFEFVEPNPQGIGPLLTAPLRGFINAAEIIGFVLIVGGAFGVFQRTRAVDSAIMGIAKAHKNSKLIQLTLIPLLMLIFALGGAVFGMSEEVIPFILVFIPLALMLGYDSIVGVSIPFIGSVVGFAGAFLNPFTVGIAQGIADLQIFSGMGYRIIVWFVVVSAAITFVSLYAKKIKRNPESSPVYELDKAKRKLIDTDQIEAHEGITLRHKIVLLTFLAGLGVLILGVLEYEWYIQEISALFFLLGIAVGIVGKLKVTEVTDSFVSGAKDLISTALVIALARGILVLAQDGKIIDTILFSLSKPISALHPILSSQAMFGLQTVINFFVPSGSGQAVLTMPIMAPLSDLVGVSRQTAVLAFQMGDGFSNLIIPTSAVTMGILALAGIPWEKWAKWISPLFVILMLLGMILLIPPYFFNWQ
jgi:uncharacterized ion transporter superfamily protein YfcC